nr:TPA_asm: PolB [Tasmanian devil feces monodnaparvovirus 2]
MAEPMPVNGFRAGYFYTYAYDDLWNYCMNYLQQVQSIRLTVHTSGLFQTVEGQQCELHIANPHNYDLDIEMVNLDDIREEIEALCTDPDNFPQYAGSGLVLLAITTWWFKVIPFQPNANARPNGRNTVQNAGHPIHWDGMEDISNDEDVDPNVYVQNSFYDAMYYCLHPEEQPESRRPKQKKRVFRWYMANCFGSKKSIINPSEVPAWHDAYGSGNLCIFNMRGNIIYHRELDHKEGEPMMMLYNGTTRRFHAIREGKLAALFGENSVQKTFCWKCKKFHGPAACKIKVEPAKSQFIKLPKHPEGKHSMIMYADFEAISKVGEVHQPSGFVLIAMAYGQVQEIECVNSFNEPDIINNFMHSIKAFIDRYQAGPYDEVHECCACYEQGVDDYVVEGRSYITGVKGSYHSKCWESLDNVCPIYFHNWRGYDNHLVIRHIISNYQNVEIKARSFEKVDNIFITDEKFRIKFGDTMNFLMGSLASLAKGIREFKFTPPEHRSTKAYFPYDWFNNLDKLNPGVPIPLEGELWGSVVSGVKEVDMDEVKALIAKYDIRDFAGWHDFYMARDGWLLCEVFEEFRKTVFDAEGIDPIYFQGSPGLTWWLALRRNPTGFMVINESTDLYQLIQSQIRGGVAQCSKRYVEISNPNEYLLYWDVNSLYSSCMMHKMPTQYIKEEKVWNPQWLDWNDENSMMCALIEVDLSHERVAWNGNYVVDLHDVYRDMPPCPHHFQNRLCTTFLEKKNYLVHNQALAFYLQHGMKITKFHTAYIFYHDKVLADYVNENIEKRIAAEGDASYQGLYKLLNNALYGKTCENVFKYKSFKIIDRDPNDEEELDRQRNHFLSDVVNFLIVDQKLYCEKQKKLVTLSKPVQIGFTVLEHAKIKLLDMWYKVKFAFQDHVDLCYTDTDSILMHFKDCTRHPLVTIKDQFPEIYQLLDFERGDEPIHTENTYKVSGLWSNEIEGKIMTHFCGLRAKTYACKFSDDSEKLKNKGVTKAAIEIENKVKINFDHYKEALFDAHEIRVEQHVIRSRKHEVRTKYEKKLALSSTDNKRIVLPNRIDTVPFGYRGKMYKPILDDVNFIE